MKSSIVVCIICGRQHVLENIVRTYYSFSQDRFFIIRLIYFLTKQLLYCAVSVELKCNCTKIAKKKMFRLFGTIPKKLLLHKITVLRYFLQCSLLSNPFESPKMLSKPTIFCIILNGDSTTLINGSNQHRSQENGMFKLFGIQVYCLKR